MNDLLPDPPRWRDANEQANLTERTAGATVRSLAQPEPLSPAQLARIAARIRAARTRRVPRLLPVFAALLLGIATAASAAHLNLLPSWLDGGKTRSLLGAPHEPPSIETRRRARERTPAPVSPGATEPKTSEAAPAPPATAAPAQQAAAAPEPAPQAELRVAHRKSVGAASDEVPARTEPALPRAASPVPRIPAMAERPPTAPETVPTVQQAAPQVAWLAPAVAPPRLPPSAAASTPPARFEPEPKHAGQAAKQLTRAIRLLRSQHDPATALVVLDANARALADEGLGHEALIVRVEALLVLERGAEALQLLDGVTLSDAAASHALLVTRGKLRAAAHRCADGIGDFSLVLAEARRADRQALFGRALCRQQLGDREGARADLDRYRRDFPGDDRLPELERRLGVRH
jgi:hypothetical protein